MEESFYHQYAECDERHWWFIGRQRIVRQLLDKWLPPLEARRILDVGCGTGGMLKLLSEYGNLHGIDTSPEAIEYSRARAGDVATLHQGQVPDALPAGMSFDLITLFDVLEHMPEPVQTLIQLRAVLAANATLVCTVPAFSFLWSQHDDINHHYRRYTRDMLRSELERGGFEVRYSSYFNTLLFPPVALLRLVQRVLPKGEGQSDFTLPPPFVNDVLAGVFGSERHLMRRVGLPFGVSLAMVAFPRKG
jgi:SAM-dependent methyltransferase